MGDAERFVVFISAINFVTLGFVSVIDALFL